MFFRINSKEPCSVSLSETQFSYVLPPNKLGTDAANVTGRATRVSDTVIIYELTLIEAQEQGATIQTSGKFDFSAINQLPANTVISDWVITTHDSDGTNPEKLLELNIVVNTIEDLRTLGLFGSKP